VGFLLQNLETKQS